MPASNTRMITKAKMLAIYEEILKCLEARAFSTRTVPCSITHPNTSETKSRSSAYRAKSIKSSCQSCAVHGINRQGKPGKTLAV